MTTRSGVEGSGRLGDLNTQAPAHRKDTPHARIRLGADPLRHRRHRYRRRDHDHQQATLWHLAPLMPTRAPRPCTTGGCPGTPARGSAKCADCLARSRRPRPSATAQGYGAEHRDRFRAGVLARDPACVCTEETHGHASPCGAPSEHADHWPLSKRELQARGWDEHHPRHGRGLCHPCHSKETGQHQPAGWNDAPPF